MCAYVGCPVPALQNRSKLTVDLAPALLDRDNALPLALICNEVIANAVKHGFADGREGLIAVILEQVAPLRARLTIRDNGVGYDPSQKSGGMGNRLIRGLASQLDGRHTIDFDGGTVFTLEFDVLEFA